MPFFQDRHLNFKDLTVYRVEYTEKSKSLSEHLRELKSEIEVLKKEDTDSMLDRLHEESVLRGENKYSTLRTVCST